MADGFLSRWSRRKLGHVDEPSSSVPADPKLSEVAGAQEAEVSPLPTLEDVEKIDRFAPDFSAFMRPDVDPAVQQAALKKMFSDPHFNVMDGLDIYIDDYSKPDPLPAGMLQKLVQSDMLKLFRKGSEDQNEGAHQETLEVSGQTDLISTHPTESQEVISTEQMPIEIEKKKP